MNTTRKAATFRVKEIDNNRRISFNLSHIGINLQSKDNGSLQGFEFRVIKQSREFHRFSMNYFCYLNNKFIRYKF